MGLWQDDVRQGSGIVVTLDGMYFEGNFTNDKLTVSRKAVYKLLILVNNMLHEHY